MAKEFLPVFLDFNETTQDLDDAQCGRLIRALVEYAKGNDPELEGIELIAYRFLKGTIDRNARLSAVRAQSGSKGGYAKSEKQKLANDSKSWQNVANDSKSKQNAINNDNDNDNDIDSKQFLDDADAFEIQREQDRIMDAAEDAGFKMSNTVRAKLIALYADYGLDKMLSGFMECATHGAPNIAYLEAVLKGTGKKPVKVLPVHDFPQRDYSSVDDELMNSLAREMEAFQKGAG